MILQASYGCWLTQEGEVATNERKFEKTVVLPIGQGAAVWREITSAEKEKLSAFVDLDNLNIDALDKVDKLVSQITERINDAALTDEEALTKMGYFPDWASFIGMELAAGFRVKHSEFLYEVIQKHTVQSDWTPDAAVSLYKAVQVSHEGTEDDGIEWVQGMVLENGKHYLDNGVKYLCIRDSGTPLYYDLADLVSAGYVEIYE